MLLLTKFPFNYEIIYKGWICQGKPYGNGSYDVVAPNLICTKEEINKDCDVNPGGRAYVTNNSFDIVNGAPVTRVDVDQIENENSDVINNINNKNASDKTWNNAQRHKNTLLL